MLDLKTRQQYEATILGVYFMHPELVKARVSQINERFFSDSFRHTTWIAIRERIHAGGTLRGDELLSLFKPEDHAGNHFAHWAKHSDVLNLDYAIKELTTWDISNKLYELGVKIQDMALNDSSVKAMLSYINKATIEMDPSALTEFASTMEQALTKLETNVINFKDYNIGWDFIDNNIPFGPQNITVIGGNEGTFKTKLMIFFMRILVTKYSNISILWYSMEDPDDKLLRGFIAQDELLDDKTIQRLKNQKELISSDISKAKIEFVTKSSTIKEIGVRYSKFRNEHEGQFCILIIDNIMKLIPITHKGENEHDLEIVREIESWNVKTSSREAQVILLHHFTKAALDPVHLYKAFEPEVVYLRGGGRYKDMATQVMLVNAMYSHAQIRNLFKQYKSWIEKHFIIKVDKNRNGKKGYLRLLAYAGINHFYPLD